MFRIGNRTLPRQLIGFLTVLASALSISLPRNRAIATSRLADASRCKYEIDVRKNVIGSMGVVLNSSSVQKDGSFGSTINLSSLHNLIGRDTRNFRCYLRRISLSERFGFFPTVRAGIDKRL